MTFDLAWAFLDALGDGLYALLDVLHREAPNWAYAMETGFDASEVAQLQAEDDAAEAAASSEGER